MLLFTILNKLTDMGNWTRLQSAASTLVFKGTHMVYYNRANTEGGAVYSYGASVIVGDNCNFSHNVANGLGGAIVFFCI